MQQQVQAAATNLSTAKAMKDKREKALEELRRGLVDYEICDQCGEGRPQ